ncbi:MAG TPA: crosslink repair DNA glycosylase YcaQ family protein, partial [Actinomycetota bacterium]|nr:crosslink repair DNA glycosylase YcaQ family protein [Actinomycetota bacterium]
VEIEGDAGAWPGDWFVLASDAAALRRFDKNPIEPRTTLLSPFDNLIADRDRTERVFDFEYRIEIYVPKAKRRYGYYVLPILHGDRLIGRVDSKFEKQNNAYVVDHVFGEASAPKDKATAAAVKGSLESMASWLGADSLSIGDPGPWPSIRK